MRQPTYDVLSYGTIGLDTIIRVPHWPDPDISTHALEEDDFLGGKATNAAAFLSTWGLSVAVSGTTLGDDDQGRKLLSILGRYPGIATRYLKIQPGLRSMYCCILVTPDGERAIIGVRADSVPQTPPTREMIEDARSLTLDLYGGPERVDAARLAHAAGRPVVVGDVRDPDHPVLPYTTVAIASAAELRISHPGLVPADFAHAATQRGVQSVLVTCGGEPVSVYEGGHLLASIRPPQVEVVDSTGAGDAFRAGVVYGVLAGWPLVESAALGIAAGTLNVGRRGAAQDPPSLDEVQAVAAALPR